MQLCERLGWSYDQLMDAPAWWVERAALWFDVRAEWQAEQQEKK